MVDCVSDGVSKTTCEAGMGGAGSGTDFRLQTTDSGPTSDVLDVGRGACRQTAGRLSGWNDESYFPDSRIPRVQLASDFRFAGGRGNAEQRCAVTHHSKQASSIRLAAAPRKCFSQVTSRLPPAASCGDGNPKKPGPTVQSAKK